MHFLLVWFSPSSFVGNAGDKRNAQKGRPDVVHAPRNVAIAARGKERKKKKGASGKFPVYIYNKWTFFFFFF